MKIEKGIWAATGAYLSWGLLPIYWKSLVSVPAYEILGHRISWSMVFTLSLLLVFGRAKEFTGYLKNRKILLALLGSSVLLSSNWIIYIWAVNEGYVVETSLGYFINPLLNVFLGVVFLKERLRIGQAAALFIALSGVIYLSISYGRVPWIALSLALTFGFYGLVRKTAPIPSLEGLGVETLMMFFPALVLLIFLNINQQASFISQGINISTLLIGTGVITTIPLFLFGCAAKRISLTSLGLLQYIAPTIQLLLGVFLYQEGFPTQKAIGFSLVWFALALYSIETILWRRYRRL